MIDKFKHFVIKYILSVFTAFCPYHIGHFTMVGLKMDDMVGLSTFPKTSLSCSSFLFSSVYLSDYVNDHYLCVPDLVVLL